MAHNFLSQLTGCFAMPAAENPTVAMIEAAYRHHKLDWRYINCEVTPENLGAAVAGARAMNWVGFNCSLPHKVAVIQHLDSLGKSAEIMGAVNCVVRRGTSYIGENTDGKGFLASLQEIIDPAGRSVIIFGAGGAARAVSVELALAGARSITVVNRGSARGHAVVDLLNQRTATQAELVVGKTPTECTKAPTSLLTPLQSDCFPMLAHNSIWMSGHCNLTWSSQTSSRIRLAPASSLMPKSADAGSLTALACSSTKALLV
jgi:shikimate 5-dehydrogenase